VHVLKEFFAVRIQYYDMRKASLSKKLTEEWEKLDNKVGSDHFFRLHSCLLFSTDLVRDRLLCRCASCLP
jgi:hypothetical protein